MGVLVFSIYVFFGAMGLMLGFAILPKRKKREILDFINEF